MRLSIITVEIMALTIGTQLGCHEITALLGKGGMGEVYRARDLKLKREVAIKILPGEFVQDSDPERFGQTHCRRQLDRSTPQEVIRNASTASKVLS